MSNKYSAINIGYTKILLNAHFSFLNFFGIEAYNWLCRRHFLFAHKKLGDEIVYDLY